MQNMQLVILMGGKATRLSPLSYSLPKGLLTINQKPAIYNMIIDYVKKGLNDIIFVVSPSTEAVVKSFVKKSFGNLNVKFVVQNNPQGPLEAFALCKDYITKPTLLLLGDTLCETDLDYSYDWLGYMNIKDHSHSRWCLIKTNDKDDVSEIIDKPDYTPETNKVLIGLYNFTNPALLKEALSLTYEKKRGEYQLSSMIEYYIKKQHMKGLLINSWQDTGTLEDYANTLRNSISGRSFNAFTLNEYGILTKKSSYAKLNSEIMWLKKIQNSDMNFLIPQFIGSSVNEDEISYKMEYVNGTTLAEYFMYYDISEPNWKFIFDKFIKFGKLMWSKKAPKNSEDIVPLARKMYLNKTEERIVKWDRQDILNQEYVYANGEKLYSFSTVYKMLKNRLEKLITTSKNFYSIIHGDICFSNVIYLPAISTFKLLDPRGNFGVDMIYGDYRYDIAKIRHCYHGLYDYITQGLYSLKEVDVNNFEYSFLTSEITNPSVFDDILTSNGFNIDDIELIEGLLFISMIPLHSDDKNAQIMYYLMGLKCLNNQLEKE